MSSDVNRAARLLETGLWSFELLARGARAANQARELAQAADQARAQVVSALRQARETWAQVRREHAGHGGHWPGQLPARALQAAQRGAAAERQRAQRTAQAEQRRQASPPRSNQGGERGSASGDEPDART